MSDGVIEHPLALFVFILANILITMGYIFLAIAVIPKIRISLLRTKIGGVGFFLFCGATHLDMAFHALFFPGASIGHMMTSPIMLAIHVPQAVCVWLFVTGLYVEVGNWVVAGVPPIKVTPEQDI